VRRKHPPPAGGTLFTKEGGVERAFVFALFRKEGGSAEPGVCLIAQEIYTETEEQHD